MKSANRLPNLMIRVTGAGALLCAAFGFLYNASSLTIAVGGGFDRLVDEEHLSGFYPAFYWMSAICVTFYAGLTWCGVQFLRLRPRAVWPFGLLMLTEAVYFFALGPFAANSKNSGVAGASGVASGGLMMQVFCLLPLWGPPFVIWARSRIERNGPVS